MAFEKIFKGNPNSNNVVSSSSPQQPQLGIDTDADTLYVNTGQGWTEVGVLGPSGVTAGSYTSTNLTVNSEGIITAASNGSGGGGDFTKIAQVTLTGSSPTITFSSIPQTFSNLRITGFGACDDADVSSPILLNFNADSGNNYDYAYVLGGGSTSAHQAQPALEIGIFPAAQAFANQASQLDTSIANYSMTGSFFKTLLAQSMFPTSSSEGVLNTQIICGQWRSTAAITEIVLTDANGGNFISGSQFTLYGLK